MKIPTTLLWRVLLDVRLQPSDTIERDYKYICSRYQREGMSFLTITLPRLDDALLKGLASGRLTHADWEGFKPHKKRGSLPALLQGFFRRIFDIDGRLLPVPDVCAIFAIRQVTRLFKKVELPCSDQRIHAAYERYKNNDREVSWNRHRNPLNASLWASVCGYLWSDLEELSGELYCFPGLFGSGATAERRGRNNRHSVREWPERSTRSFPPDFHAVSRPDSPDLSELRIIPYEREHPVRVVQVPKTLKTPRTISVEPSYMMLMQQSVAQPLMWWLESGLPGFDSIRFTDQSVNRELARRGSIDGSLATIDLSDASDMVDLDLVRNIFGGVAPSFLALIEDSRSRTARMPDGTILSLRKFASMGSALCFPIESMVFFTIVMYCLIHESGKRPSRTLVKQLSRDVAVYGDDIIVPASVAERIMETLEDFGLRVNHDKSFSTGLFRESCGGDYYAGVDVTPAYVRSHDYSRTKCSPAQVSADVALSNILYMKGLWNASQYVRDTVDLERKRARRKRIPVSMYPIGCLHYCSLFYSDSLEYDPRTHSYRVRGNIPRPSIVSDEPETFSGFLSLSLGARLFQDRLRALREKTRDGHAGSYIFRDEASRFVEGNILLRGHSRIPGFAGDSIRIAVSGGLTDWGKSYGECLFTRSIPTTPWVPNGRVRITEFRPDRLYTSEKAHSLCLKSAWTASPAGLEW
nr:MAG: hypothetical protein 3 [Leviviridae sp.]